MNDNPNRPRPRVLVFDDDLVHHPDFLEGLPVELIYRPHADRCLDDVAAVDPDLVLMDFSMRATLTGLQAVQRLREVHPIGSLKIVGISSDSRMNRLMLEAGADDAVVKGALPERFRELLDLLDLLG